jgi:hypothetical protein
VHIESLPWTWLIGVGQNDALEFKLVRAECAFGEDVRV